MAKLADEVHVAMIGKLGSGKTSAAKILFKLNDLKVVKGEPYTVGDKLKLMIFDLSEDIKNIENEKQTLVEFLNVGKKYVIFVLSLLNRITEADEKIFETFTLFTEEYGNNVVLIFTHAFVLRRKGMEISDYILVNGPPVLQEFVTEFSDRYFVIDNDNAHSDFEQNLWVEIQRTCEEDEGTTEELLTQVILLIGELQSLEHYINECIDSNKRIYVFHKSKYRSFKKLQGRLHRFMVIYLRKRRQHYHTSIGFQTKHAQTSIGIQTNIPKTNNRRCQTEPTEFEVFSTEPTEFELDENYIRAYSTLEFLRNDFKNEDNRHMIFANNRQLNLLSMAKTFYIDINYTIVSKPFIQLLSIHFFAQHNDDMKQLPGVFVLMSRKETTDYIEVLQQILGFLPQQPVVARLVVDFDDKLWRAVKCVFPDIKIQGCAFHWRQVVWRKVQEIGLQNEYLQKDTNNYKFIRKLLALPFLPAREIIETFNALNKTVDTEKLAEIMDYINNTWIEGNTWKPSIWTVYRHSVRTNEDVEGWIQGINRKAQKLNLNHNVLMVLLFNEACLLPPQLKIATDTNLRQYQRSTTTYMQHQIFKLWHQFRKKQISVNQLLKKCGKVYGDPA